MDRIAKATAALGAAKTARNCAALLNGKRVPDPTGKPDTLMPALTPRTIRKARQGRDLALVRVADSLGYVDDEEQS